MVINFLQLIRPEIIIEEFTIVRHQETGSVPQAIGTGTSVARDEDLNRGTIPMLTFARRPSTISSLFPVDIPQNSVVGQQRQQISELQFDKFPTLYTCSCWKIRFKSLVTSCSDFSVGGHVMDQRSRDGRYMDEFESSRSTAGKNFSNFEMLDARVGSALN